MTDAGSTPAASIPFDDGGMITEFCRCRRHRPLARFKHHSNVVDVLYSKAAVKVSVLVEVDSGECTTEITPGSAKCIRRSCRWMRRT